MLAALGSAAAAVDLLHSIELDPDVIVRWTPENETNSITFRVEARTRWGYGDAESVKRTSKIRVRVEKHAPDMGLFVFEL